MKKMKNQRVLFISFLVILMLSGCARNTEENKPTETSAEPIASLQKEPAADGYDRLGGLWKVDAIYLKNQFLNIHDYEQLEDMYDATFLTFDEDGTCQYWNLFITDAKYRRYETDNTNKERFLLDEQRTYRLDFQDDKIVEIGGNNSKPHKAKYLVTLLDKDTLQLDTFDSVSGKAAADSVPLLFVKNTMEEESGFYDFSAKDESISAEHPTEHTDALAPVPNIGSGVSMGERNALQSAKNYLAVTAFSYSGLIEQLEYEGYSHSEAVYGADHCGVDWFEQAVKSAKNYLDIMAFSRSDLIEQLEYEGFTHEQAIYGAEQNGY